MYLSEKNLLILTLVLCYVVRILTLQGDVSFDYPHYISFLEEIGKGNPELHINSIAESFPYVIWGGEGKFEIGFYFFSLPFAYLLEPELAYVSITGLSLFLKLKVAEALGAKRFGLITLFVFLVSIFEANTVRAGVALSFLAFGLLFYARKKSFALITSFFVAAGLTHVSAILFSILYVFALLIRKLNRWRFASVLLVSFFVVIAFFSNDLFLLIGGKLTDYIKQAEEFGLYTGASGINSASLLASIIFGKFVLLPKNCNERHGFSLVGSFMADSNFIKIWIVLVSGLGIALFYFVSGFSIVADRYWHFAFYLLLPFVLNFSSYKSGSGRVAKFFYRFAIVSLIAYYGVVSPIFIYQQTNIFAFLTEEKVFQSMVLY